MPLQDIDLNQENSSRGYSNPSSQDECIHSFGLDLTIINTFSNHYDFITQVLKKQFSYLIRQELYSFTSTPKTSKNTIPKLNTSDFQVISILYDQICNFFFQILLAKFLNNYASNKF
ncbi:hypothetical protein TTHERM_000109291 (macronuclear) [Tetrahymena thermophila SB210]|uniref:Uncharacterized protein n=1 Tax=Tetrahymena thermophila (strain SB210) TaxID=312017 RepID=W7XFV6_TETTS|nr:hypothetical protein TTHERM_000109291 [Tetrahymena thermophila SB210]EWS75758.1 hypothetical protein TTHERM_000109291 [Tetrahymena thermophila SB210]|eukprot:XP_012651680.1 hypothetical protein TTHERM_000109291 [Tetrahymena thermophila SB210]